MLNKDYFSCLIGNSLDHMCSHRILFLSYWFFSCYTWQCLTLQRLGLICSVVVSKVGIQMLMDLVNTRAGGLLFFFF